MDVQAGRALFYRDLDIYIIVKMSIEVSRIGLELSELSELQKI